MEQTLGHVTHAENFRYWATRDPEVELSWIPVNFDVEDRWHRTPVVKSYWTLQASLRARDQLRARLLEEPFDALFFHTKVTALLSQSLMRRIPAVVSMDATPLNFDRIGGPYNHRPSDYSGIEAIKNALNRRTFKLARKLIIWNQWGKESLVHDYGVCGDKVVVIPPGVNLEQWRMAREESRPGRARLLFVGGDFRRKGGETLMRAFRDRLQQDCELDIVTREPVDTQGLANVRVHHGVGSNSQKLMELYSRADIFVFPTFGDVIPIAIMEAMASGLPVVTTSVGAIREQVEDGITGFLIPPGDDAALVAATLRLTTNEVLRRQMGAAARSAADRLYDGARNYAMTLAVCKGCVNGA